MLYSDSMAKLSAQVLLIPCAILGWAFFLFSPIILNGQASSAMGSIAGTILDPQGRPVPEAKLTIRNTDFTNARTVTADDSGHFVATFLPVGPYTVQVSAPGFELKKPVRLTVGAGSSTSVELRVSIKTSTQSVTVTGSGRTVEGNTVSMSVNQQDPVASNQIAGLTVTYLPNRDRDFSQMAQLAAGAEADPDGSGLVVAGQRPEATKISIDGADFNDPLRGGQRGAEDGTLFFPQVVVREFQLVRAGATADVGGTNAGFINVATKSGSNKPRGEAFYIGRPSWLTSDDAFGHSLDNVQNEFGGAIGGPIKKDKAFYYFGFEQDFLNLPYWTEFAQQAPGVTVPDALASQQQQIVGKSSPTAVFGRGDFVLNAKNTLNLQLNYNHVNTTNIGDGWTRTVASAENQSSLGGDSVWARVSLTSVISPIQVNHLLVDWGMDRRDYAPNSRSPEMFINGFGVLGGTAFGPHNFTSNRFAMNDDYSVSRHNSTWSFGGFVSVAPARSIYEPYLNERFDFDSLNDFTGGNVRRYRQTFVAGSEVYDNSVTSSGLYVALKQSITNSLTLNAGLRWEGQFNPSPAMSVVGPQKIPIDANQWQPRLGLAWNPRGSTVLRASAGLYDAPTPAAIFQHVFTDNGINTRVVDSYYDPQVLPLVAGLQPLPGLPPGLTVQSGLVYGMADNFRNPRSLQAAANVEQQVNSKLTVTAGYLHNSTWALQRLVNDNLFAPTFAVSGMPIFPTTRPNAAVGEFLVNESSGHSTYDGMTVTANAQIGRRSQFMINYTLARSRDDGSRFDPFQPTPVLDPFHPRLDAAYSDFDIRNNLNVSAVFNLPKGFKINPILLARSGAPYNPITGVDTQNDGLDFNDRALRGGQVLPRNIFRQPAFANLDVRFVKDFTLKGEGHHLDLFLDVFNVTGASNLNFGTSGLSFYGSATAPVFIAGQALYAPATTRYGGARSVQFTARLVAF
jgi:hypothetical protein